MDKKLIDICKKAGFQFSLGKLVVIDSMNRQVDVTANLEKLLVNFNDVERYHLCRKLAFKSKSIFGMTIPDGMTDAEFDDHIDAAIQMVNKLKGDTNERHN